MKKVTAILLVAMILTSVFSTVVAAGTKNTEISMTVDPSLESYVLIIPATVEIDPTERVGEIDVVLSDVELFWNTFLTVYATSANHVDGEGGSYLVDTTDSTKKISYSIFSECGGTSFVETEQGLYAAGYTAAHEWRGSSYIEKLEDGKMTITVDGTLPGSGVYTDTLTFSVELQTMNDRYDNPDRDISLEEMEAFFEFLYDEYDRYFDETSSEYGTYHVVNDASEAISGKKYVLESDLSDYLAIIQTSESIINVETNLTQDKLNDMYHGVERTWKSFWTTKIKIN